VGSSFGYCIRDILRGEIKLEQVVAMETHTRIKDEKALIRVIWQYSQHHWPKDLMSKAVEISYELFFNRPFFQSRIYGGYSVCDGDKETWMFAHHRDHTSLYYEGKWKPKYKRKTLDRKIKKAKKTLNTETWFI
jgi:hypothetical protein|tara:strand:+ start:85 stop:486 length:402 start_codon:yes stop_codon:yes gene_type:complete